MKKLHKSWLALALLGTAGLAACEKQLDINVDPTRPGTATPDLVLPAGTGNLSFVLGGSFNIVGNFFAQHWTESLLANQYKDYDRYRIGESSFNREYQTLYTGGLKNYRYVMDHAKGDSSNYAAIAGLQAAYTFQVLNDGFDAIPFTDALQGAANTQPRFDQGPVIYDGLITMIDDAMGKINPSGVSAGKQDLIFQGDMEKWRRFGNTLKLKIYLRQVYARPTVTEEGIRGLYRNGATFLGATEDAQVTGFSTVSQNGNPLYLTEVAPTSGIANNIIASQTVIDYLNSTNDPRIDDLFDRPGNSTTAAHVGTPQGEAVRGGSAAISTKSRPDQQKIAGPASPVVFMSGAESLFLQAEAALRGYAAGANAQALYEQGIAASFARLGRTMPATFLANSNIAFDQTAGFTERKLDQIITQKWVSMSGSEGFEAWTELRRTRYPSIVQATTVSDLPTGVIAKRLVYPTVERQTNAGNFPGVVKVDVPVWWDKKP